MSNIENLVFEGGGVLGFAYVGVVQVLEEENILKSVKRFAGSSAGGITAALLACGATASILESALETLDATELFDSSFFVPLNVYRLWNGGGWTKGKKLELWISNLISTLCQGNTAITLQEVFEKFGKIVVLTGTCLETQKTEYFSMQNYPKMPLNIAVRISAGYPCVYPMIELLNFHWWDGGIGDNYPVHIFDENHEKHCKDRIPNMKTIGFKLVSQLDVVKTQTIPINNVKDAVISVAGMILDMSRSIHVHEIDWQRSVLIDVSSIGAMKFDITDAEKKFLIKSGRKATEEFIHSADWSN